LAAPAPSSVVLRDVAQGDLPIFFEHQRDPESNRMADFPARENNAFMSHWAEILGDESVTKKTIVFEGHVAGNVVGWGPPDERAVGYWIGREYWGRGAATRALSLFLDHEQTRPLYAHVAAHHASSIRVLEKCGFTISGRAAAPSGARDELDEELVLQLRA